VKYESYETEVKNYTVGDFFKFGLYLCFSEDGYPILNLYVLNDILKHFYNKGKIETWMPAFYFLKLIEIDFSPEDKYAFQKFELFQIQYDAFYRILLFYNKELFPIERKLSSCFPIETQYSKIFPQAIITGLADGLFQIRSSYKIINKFMKFSSSGGKYTCFNYFDKNDWDYFYEGNCMVCNTESGFAFDFVCFDPPNFFTFYQFKYRSPKNNEKK